MENIYVSTFIDEHDSIYVYAELDKKWIGNHLLRFEYEKSSTGLEITFKEPEQVPSEITDTVKPSVSIPLHIHTSEAGSQPISFILNQSLNQGTLHVDSSSASLTINQGINVFSGIAQ